MSQPWRKRVEPSDGAVVSLCDRTGIFCEPWAASGFECWCVDIQHPIRAGRRKAQIHYVWGDVRSWIPPTELPVVFVAAFPPCTHVAASGARDFKTKGVPLLADALELFNACQHAAGWSGAPYFIENPVGAFSTHIRKPDYTFSPCEYGGYLDPPGDAYTKKTCLWAGNGFVMPEPKPVSPVLGSAMHKLSPSSDRTNLRSETPRGFAQAVFEANAGVTVPVSTMTHSLPRGSPPREVVP